MVIDQLELLTLNGLSIPGIMGSLANIRNRVTLSESSCKAKATLVKQSWKLHNHKSIFFSILFFVPQANLYILSKYIQAIDPSGSLASNSPRIFEFVERDELEVWYKCI